MEKAPKATTVKPAQWVRRKLVLVTRVEPEEESESEPEWETLSEVEEPEGYRSEEY